MTNKKPKFVFHGYRKFDKFLAPSVKHPFWTGTLDEALDYSDDSISTSGILMLKLESSKLNILDIYDKFKLVKLFGWIGEIISSNASFYNAMNSLLEPKILNIPQSSSKNDIDEISIKLLIKLKSVLKKFKTIKNDKLVSEVFLPIIYNNGYNCIAEHEDKLNPSYMLISDDMLLGNCCIFITQKNRKYFKKLNVLKTADIYSDKSFDDIMLKLKKIS